MLVGSAGLLVVEFVLKGYRPKKEKRLQKKRHKRAGLKRAPKQPSTPEGKVLSSMQSFVPKITIAASEARKKPRLEAIMFCDYGNRTQDGKLMLVGCFDRIIFSAEEEKISVPFFLFIRTAETTKGNLQISIIDPKETVVLAFQVDTSKLTFEADRPANIEFLYPLRFPMPFEGYYWFDVSYMDESLGGTPLAAEFRKQEVEKDEHKTRSMEQEHVPD